MLGNCERSRVEIGIQTLCQKRLVADGVASLLGSNLPSAAHSARITPNPDVIHPLLPSGHDPTATQNSGWLDYAMPQDCA